MSTIKGSNGSKANGMDAGTQTKSTGEGPLDYSKAGNAGRGESAYSGTTLKQGGTIEKSSGGGSKPAVKMSRAD